MSSTSVRILICEPLFADAWKLDRVDPRRAAAALEPCDCGVRRAAELRQLLLRKVARPALLDDLLGNRCEEPAFLGLSTNPLPQTLEAAWSRLLLPALHSLQAIIAPRLWECLENLLGLGEAALALLRKDQVPVREHVELAFRAFGGLGLMPRPPVDLGRETRSPAVIAVSDGAVVDLDARHAPQLSDGVRPQARGARVHP